MNKKILDNPLFCNINTDFGKIYSIEEKGCFGVL